MAGPDYPYHGPAKNYSKANNKPITRIVIHGTVSSAGRGMARRIASYFRTTDRFASAHYVVDSHETLQVVWDSHVAYHAPPNTGSIGIELCEPVVGPVTRWNDLDLALTLRRGAVLAAELCVAYDIPVRRVRGRGLRAGKRGICGHNDVRDAWHQTNHWDPGAFPWRKFLRLVQREIDRIEGKPTKVTQAKIRLAGAIDYIVSLGIKRRRILALTEDLRDIHEKFPDR